jgi:hypothetical protein
VTSPFAIDFAAIKPVDFAVLIHPPAQEAATPTTPAEAPEPKPPADAKAGRTILTHTSVRRLVGLRKAADVLDSLPGPGESLHGVLYGFFNLCHLLIVLLDRLSVPCLHLRVATLSMCSRNVAELAALIDCGAVKRLDVLTSDFQRKHDKAIFAELLEAMHQRGQRVAAARSHCKLLLLDMEDGRKYALEGSPNLRTSRNAEQFCLTQDALVHDHYAVWFDEVVTAHEVHASDGATTS